jgi:putative ABC transport system permease protein
MKANKLTRLVGQNIQRNFGHFAMSAIGIVIGVATLSFFVGLRNGIKVWIHSEDILPLNKIEVIPPRSDLEISSEKLGRKLDDEVVEKIRQREEVKAAYPKMKFAFPGLARGGRSLFGQDIQIEFIGDGIDPDLVADEQYKEPLLFKDFWAVENPNAFCQLDSECPAGRRCNAYTQACTMCDTDAECGAGRFCEPAIRMCLPSLRCWPEDPHVRRSDGRYVTDAAGQKLAKKSPHDDCRHVSARFRCDPETKRCTNHCTFDDHCGKFYYCDKSATHTCYRAVPALVSRYLIELYNGNIAPGRNWPKINEFFASQFFGLVITAHVGDSVIGTGRKKSRTQMIQLVGISRKAINLGLTLPVGYVKRWNQAFALRDEQSRQILPEERHKFTTYSSVVVWLRSKGDVSRFAHFCKQLGFEQNDSAAEMVGNFIDFVGLLLGIVSLVILVISAMNISHTYFMIISERRREIGIMRAVGANRWDIRTLFIGEALVLGLMGGGLGLGIGRGLAALVDFVSRKFVAEFMFKPKTYFDFTWWVWVGAIGFAILFCFIGTIFPANRAAKMEPAEALSIQ